ncbi:uncharacterized protein LOC118467240 isoform X1 [Anopheles albimanus]|uniref:uncharacterized protein LOC118467240 isoform X1 n=1 Tax=Anopheles albimanus TaxID=7167 RepID=UPI00163E90B6|nr:uncharacterized protein LOC118467240 isoform X1 [Anopheles albimanus]XP_035793399.1 uncharacterized protein LOC118467240 isoform X1 [Anopheles albimanus]
MLNEAGQGKSTYVTWLAAQLKKKEPSMWIIRLNCIDYCTDFERLLVEGQQVTIKSFKALRILFVLIHLVLFVPTIKTQMISDTDLERQIATKSAQCIGYSEGSLVLDEELTERLGISFEQRLLLRLFQYKFNHHEIILLVDGFNEIAPHYTSVVLELLTGYREFRGVLKMYITCRPYNFQKLFETHFNCALVFQLPVISLEEKRQMLHLFAINRIPKNHPNTALGKYFHAIIAVITIAIMRNLQEMSDVPLFLRIAMEELLPIVEKYVNFGTGIIKRALIKEIDVSLDKLRLVETIIDRIIRIAVLQKTGVIDMPSTSPSMIKFVEDIVLILNIRYKLLAVWVMFSENDRQDMLTGDEFRGQRSFLDEIIEGSDKTGIIQCVQGYTPIFGQRLFSEYLAAQFIIEDRTRNPRRCFHTRRAYWSHELLNIRRFIDTILLGSSEKYPLHMAVIEGDEPTIIAILRDRPDTAFQKDPKARTVLHLAALYPVSEDVLDLFPNNVEQSFINAWEEFIPTSLLSLAFLKDNGKMIWYCLCENASIDVHLITMQMTCTKDMIIFQVGRFDFHVMSYLYEHGLYETDAGKSTLEAMTELCDTVIQRLVNEKAIDFYDPEYLGGNEKECLLERFARLDAVLLLKSFVKNAEGLQNLYIGIDQLFQKALDSSAFFVMEYLICEANLEVPASTKEGKLIKCIEAGKKNKNSAIYKLLVKEFCNEHRQARITMENL